MHRTALVACALAALAGLGALPIRAGPAQPLLPAHRVVVRGQTDLAEAIRAATPAAGADPTLLVLDVTPHTRAALPTIRDALERLAGSEGGPRRWRLARLGEAPSPPVPGCDRLAPLLAPLLGKDTDVVDTIGALRRTVGHLPRAGGAVVYLADWHFEDEHDLEDLASDLEARGLGFGVVGSEAGWGRAWNDGVFDWRDRLQGEGMLRGSAEEGAYDPAIGRRPFGPFDEKAPWHGGDTAWPHQPYRFAQDLWKTEFTPDELDFGEGGLDRDPGDASDLEDLLERMGRARERFSEASFRRFPLPSAFGPHGLMRLAALRGGRYVLWSWNPDHRVALHYDYARCNAYAPDLRTRSEIRKDVPRDDVARALVRAWEHLCRKDAAPVVHTPPLGGAGRTPQSIDLVDARFTRLSTMWADRQAHRAFLDTAEDWRDAVVEATRMLERALEKDGEDGPGHARYRADAETFRHVLEVLAFELGEAIRVASEVPDDAWDDDLAVPGIVAVTWIERGDDPDDIRKTGATVRDPAAGEAVEAARRSHLRRYRGTPFGTYVAANTVDTWRLERIEAMKGSPGKPPGRTPSESGGETEGPTTPTTPSARPPGGTSGGGGPATGR